MEDFDSFLSDMPLTSVEDGLTEPDLSGFLKAKRKSFAVVGTSPSEDSSSVGQDDGKKQKQLERNRETAKRCRRRKREKADALSDEVARLRETNKELEIQLKICKSQLGQTKSGRGNRGEEEEKRRIAEMNRISQMIDQKCSESEINLRVSTYTDVYSDYGEERRNVIKAQLNQLKALLLPTKISKMLLWILEQDDEFFSSGEGSTIWKTLNSEMNIDPKQKELFLTQRNKLGKQNVGFKNIIRKLKLLESEILENMDRRGEQMKEITNLFTPSQQAKFLHWVENNEACVLLLDTLWKQRTAAEEAKKDHAVDVNGKVKEEN